MQAAECKTLKLIYEGSVKRVFAPESASPNTLWFEFTDDYSVFDWGKMPDTIAQKGRALTVMGTWFFQTLAPAKFWQSLVQSPFLKRLTGNTEHEEFFGSNVYKQLASSGLPAHFHRLVDKTGTEASLAQAAASSESVFMEVSRADVLRPTAAVILGRTIYSYPAAPSQSSRSPSCRLIPLEVVFRFGMPAGSSLKSRLEKDPAYAEQLGFSRVPSEDSLWGRPVLEFFTKLEPKDRLLSLSEALAISTLSAEQFQSLCELAQLCALALYHIFAEKGIEIWDGKFEFILDGDTIKLADSIGPDELRLIYKSMHLSKEIIRQVYRGSKWEQGLKEAQQLGAERPGQDWKAICRDQLKLLPEPLPVAFKNAVDLMYPTLVNHLSGQQLFADQPDLDGLVSQLKSAK